MQAEGLPFLLTHHSDSWANACFFAAIGSGTFVSLNFFFFKKEDYVQESRALREFVGDDASLK